MSRFCTNCAKELEDSDVFCPQCGRPVGTEPNTAVQMGTDTAFFENKTDALVKIKRKKKFLVAMLYVIGFFVAVGVVIKAIQQPSIKEVSTDNTPSIKRGVKEIQPEKSQEEIEKEQQERWLEMDALAWQEFIKLYNAHYDFMKTIQMYSHGEVDKLTMYDYCDKAEEIFMGEAKAILNAQSKEVKEYMSNFLQCAYADQQAAEFMKYYIDSEAMADFYVVIEQLEIVGDELANFVENRGQLLAKTGLTEEEIKVKIKQDVYALDHIDE